MNSRLRDGRLSQAWKPECDTSGASHSQLTGQICRCFAMKVRGDDYDGRLSDNYDGRYARPSGPLAGRGEAPTVERA